MNPGRREANSEIIDRVHQVGRQFFSQLDNVELRAAKKAAPGTGRANSGQIEKPAESGTQPKPKK